MYVLVNNRKGGTMLAALNSAEPVEQEREGGKMYYSTSITYFEKHDFPGKADLNRIWIDLPFKQFMTAFEAAQSKNRVLDLTREGVAAIRKSFEPQDPAAPVSARREFRP